MRITITSYPPCLLQERLHDSLDIQRPQIRVLLPHTDKHNRLPRNVRHRQRGAHLVVNRVKLCQHDPVHLPRHGKIRRVLFQRVIKLYELVDAVIPDERLADKKDLVGLVDAHDLCQLAHQRLIVLHAAGRVDKNYVIAVAARVRNRVPRNVGGVLVVALLVKVDKLWPILAINAGDRCKGVRKKRGKEEKSCTIEVVDVAAELLDGARAESVARRDQHA